VDARPLGSTNTVGHDHRAWTPMQPGVQRLLVHLGTPTSPTSSATPRLLRPEPLRPPYPPLTTSRTNGRPSWVGDAPSSLILSGRIEGGQDRR
jgi:hypothetical protein